MRLTGTINFDMEMSPTETSEDVGDRIFNAWIREFGYGDEIQIEWCEPQYECNETIEIVMNAVREALGKYPADNIDVVVDDMTGNLSVIWHSDNNSFAVSKELVYEEYVDLDKLAKELNKLNVGQVW